MMKVKGSGWAVGLLLVVVLVAFSGLEKSFYQQDEWMALGNAIALKKDYFLSRNENLISVLLGQGRVLSGTLVYFVLRVWPLKIAPFVFMAVGLHTVVVVFVFFLVKWLFRDYWAAVLAAVFFALNSVSAGAVTWPAASVGILIATLLIIGACTFFYNGGKDGRWLAFGLLYLSLYFKEIGNYLFFVLPVSILLMERGGMVKHIKNYWMYYVFGLLYFGSWWWELKSIPVQQDLFLTGYTNNFMLTAGVRAVLYPLTSVSLVLVPSSLALWWAKQLARWYYPFLVGPSFDLVSQTVVLDMLALALTVILAFLAYWVLKVMRRDARNLVAAILALGFTSYWSYVVISKSYSYLEGRYYYLGAIATTVLVGAVISVRRSWPRLSWVIVGLTLLLIGLHFRALRLEIGRLRKDGEIRRAIVSQIDTQLPEINERQAVYLKGDRNYYIEKGNPLPLQQGTGYTLMVLYSLRGYDLGDLIKERFLWDLGSQGYREVAGRGFGYFWDWEKLEEEISKGQVGVEDVVCLYYDSVANKLRRDECKNE